MGERVCASPFCQRAGNGEKKGKIKIKYTTGLSVPGAPRCREALSRLRAHGYRVTLALSLRDLVQEEKEQ